MKIIISSNGYSLQVDDEYYEILNKESWYVTPGGYAQCHRQIGNKKIVIFMHAMVLDLQGIAHPEKVDHIDMNTSNYQKDNLRPATHSESAMHRRIQKSNTSSYKGVSWHKQRNKWLARIQYQNEQISLGLFIDPEEAARAYDKAAKIYHKEFAILNFPEED